MNIVQLNRPRHSNDRVYAPDGLGPTLNTMQGGNRQPFVMGTINRGEFKTTDNALTIPASYYKGHDNHGARPMVAVSEATEQGFAIATEGDSINLSQPNSKTRRGRVGKGVAQTLDTGMQQHTLQAGRIRRLTPMECERLQGFPDLHTKFGRKPDGTVYEQSDTQRYKQMGNAVTVNVIEAIARRLPI